MTNPGKAVQQSLWRVEAGVLTTETGIFRLVVSNVSGAIRFQVLRRHVRDGSTGLDILGSGILNDARSAMVAAERMAAELAPLDQPRRASQLSE